MDYLSPLTVCLCMQLSVCLLGSTASAGGSLWGKKVRFSGRPCMWQLQPGAVVPALQELSACLLLRRNIATEWTGFVYKAPGGQRIELGLGGTSSQLTVWLFGERQPLEWELKVNEWYSVCLTWSASARRLRTYINGTSVSEAPVNRILPHQLAGNGTLTLGASHYVNNEGDVLAETGNNLLGEIGLFRIWSREWSAAELRRQSCADGDVVSWDLRQWKYSCPPVPDKSIHCAWSHYKIKMTTVIVHSTEPGNCVVPPEGVTRRWLESIFPQSISVHDIAVSSPSQSCPVVNNSAALHVRQPQGSRALSDACDKCFSCEVHVNVDPAANVEVIQADITALLSLPFSHNFLNLTADPESISIHPVESFHLMTKPSTTVSTGVTPSETGQTQSMPARPANTSTTGNPLDHIEDHH